MLRLLLYNIGVRLQSWAEQMPLCGDAFIDAIKARWQAPNRPTVAR